jgi:glycosyltransferase involved in cell wall biosynthesis
VKIAVYTIALNEASYVHTWAASAADADYRLILDTGSTDDTVSLARAEGVDVYTAKIDPWRFDEARNEALDLLPTDIDLCIALDMDEVLLPGWREELEKLPPEVTRPRYEYTWSWNPDGTPGLTYHGDKIHARYKGYRWKHPVHEVLVSDQEIQGWCDLKIHHFPDPAKSRGQYFPMLELAVAEDPEDDRNAHYLAREYYYHGMYEKAAAEFKRHLSLPRAVWSSERAESMRYLATSEPWLAETWLLRSCAEDSSRREPWIGLAEHYLSQEDWPGCYHAATRALSITERPTTYINQAESWGWKPHDLAALAAHFLGMKQEAIRHGEAAVNLNPDDDRLNANLAFYTA